MTTPLTPSQNRALAAKLIASHLPEIEADADPWHILMDGEGCDCDGGDECYEAEASQGLADMINRAKITITIDGYRYDA